MNEAGFVRVGGVLVPVNTRRHCFAGGTLVRTQNGLKAISGLSKRDRVICILRGQEVEAEIETVTKWSKKQGFDSIVLGTSHEDVTVTPNHVFSLADGRFSFSKDVVSSGVDTFLRSLRGAPTSVVLKRKMKIDQIFNVVIAANDDQACYSVGHAGLVASDRL